MIRRAGLAMFVAWGLVLALVAGASAQDAKKDQGGKGDQKSTATRTVRGVIAGVTVEGELAVDYRNRRAVEADMTILTVVGSPRNEEGDQGQDDQHKAGHHRHNLYVLVLSPRTQVRDARDGGKDDNGKAASLDAIELGDRVEVKYTAREEDQSGDADQARKQKHGRHRTYFGDAVSITLLPQAHHDAQGSGDKKDEGGDKDKEQK